MKRAITAILIFAILLSMTACKSSDYKEAIRLLEEGQYEDSISMLETLGDYQDSAQLILDAKYNKAKELASEGMLWDAEQAFLDIKDYSDSLKYAKEIHEKQGVQLPEYIAEGVLTADLLKAYQIENATYYEHPQSATELTSTFFYCFLTGKYTFEINPDLKEVCKLNFPYEFMHCYDALLDVILCVNNTIYYSDGGFHIALEEEAPFTPLELSEQLIESYKAARRIYDYVHSHNIVKESMSQHSVAVAYNNYLLQAIWPSLRADPFTGNGQVRRMKIDGIYNILIHNNGMCSARAATFNILMNMEGIPCQTMHCFIGDCNHYVSFMVFDNVDYICDWGNRIGVITLEKYRDSATIIDSCVDIHKIMMGFKEGKIPLGWHGCIGSQDIVASIRNNTYWVGESYDDGTFIPLLEWEVTGKYGYTTHYLVRFVDHRILTIDPHCPVVLWYMAGGFEMAAMRCTLGELENGVEFIEDKMLRQKAIQVGGFTGFEIRY